MTHQFHELLLSELRMVAYQPGNPADVTDEMLCLAVTLNENIRSLGYVLRPDDMIRLSASPSLRGFFDHLKALVPDVQDKPMYPGFPQQVMEMSEAEFRLHQMIHYFSTYGLEDLLGVEVSRGWLPGYDHPERTEKDTALMDLRVIELVSEQEAPARVLSVLLGRRERLTNPELSLVLECAPLCSHQQLQGMKVRFKENIGLLFPLLMKHENREAALITLHAVCAHTGDVLENAKQYLKDHRYHLTTSDKKLLVRLLESYPVNNLRVNLMQSLHLRERNLKVLRYLDYSRFSRSEAHLEAVRALRNGELLSWHGVGEALLHEHSPEALTHFAQRPGYMVRMLSRLLSLGCCEADILRALEPRSGAISGHLVLKTLRAMMKRSSGLEKKHQEAVQACRQKYARERAIDIPDYDQEESLISSMAAYRRGEAHSAYLVQPEYEARRSAFRKAGLLKEQLELSQRRLEDQKRALRNPELTDHRSARPQWQRNAHDTMDADRLYALMYTDMPAIRSQIRHLESEIARLTEEIKLAQAEAEASFRQQMERIHAENDAQHRRVIEEIDAWERKELDDLHRRIEREMAEQAARLRDIELRREAELKELEDQHQRAVRTSLYDAQAVSILRKLLRAHFAQADTPLKGKKVFLDMKEFDLEHSVLETEDRSKDGGYIRSGIAYRIPEDAKYVRFFVYWNDTHRIDIDLHAGGVTTDGRDLHVGWNADFRDGGVVHSGDITHSDAAEYIDIDLSAPIREIYTNVHLFNDRSFKNIETCYVGMMAVDKTGQTISRYDPANCFFTHKLTQNTNSLYYGFIDVQNRFVRFVGQMNESSWAARPPVESEEAMFSLREYLDSVMGGQGAELVSSKKEADVVLTMGKSLLDCGVSLADNNFFLEC